MTNIILAGDVHSGKTTYGYKLSKILQNNNIIAGGFLSFGTFKDNIRDSFYIYSILSNKKVLLADRNKNDVDYSFGNYTFYKTGLDFAYSEYKKSIESNSKVIFIDEAGKWELSGGGFSKLLENQVNNKIRITISRSDFACDINNKFFNNMAEIINIKTDINITYKKIEKYIKANL